MALTIETINPMQWLAVDIANNFGLSHLTYEDRIDWVKRNMGGMGAMEKMAKKPIAYMKSLYALQTAMQGRFSHHPVGLDSSASGMQIMSALMRCRTGCTHTNLIGDKVSDAYLEATKIYNRINNSRSVFERSLIKQATMTYYYGSVQVPKELFETKENLESFYEAMELLAPGANKLRGYLLAAWDSRSDMQEWILPDGHEARMPVLVSRNHELVHHDLGVPITLIVMDQSPVEYSKRTCANMIHSVDAYILRCMTRRMNHNRKQCLDVIQILTDEQLKRSFGKSSGKVSVDSDFLAHQEIFEHTKMVDMAIVPYITAESAELLSTHHLESLKRLLIRITSHKPFQIMTIHDDFRCHANNVSRMADEYRHIMAELSDSNTLSFLLKQLKINVTPVGSHLGHLIRKSQYGIN